MVAAYAGLIALGRLQFGLPAVDTLLFATTRLWVDLQALAQAIVMLFAGVGEINGIVGIIAIGGSQFGSTLAGLLAFSVAINVNLAIFNLLPLAAARWWTYRFRRSRKDLSPTPSNPGSTVTNGSPNRLRQDKIRRDSSGLDQRLQEQDVRIGVRKDLTGARWSSSIAQV
jgi:hypothetical protein